RSTRPTIGRATTRSSARVSSRAHGHARLLLDPREGRARAARGHGELRARMRARVVAEADVAAQRARRGRNADGARPRPRVVRALESLAERQDVVTRLVAHEGPWQERVEITFFPQARRHADVPIAEAARCIETATPTDGRPVARPMLLVCTHGARDRCCALFG